MKNITLSMLVFVLIAVTSQVNAQTATKKEIKKEVKVAEDNGVKTLTISTTINGETSIEVYQGAEADAKIAALKKHKSGTTKTMIIGEDGKQHLKVEKKIVITEELEE